ncbi:MAG: PQQ-binding-like beta-propeller repeat protein, partial [Terracidiphilus sp.]|nr:PQQ-binding-like beta-propeller repeat protein [Terracidiphilus sp.]
MARVLAVLLPAIAACALAAAPANNTLGSVTAHDAPLASVVQWLGPTSPVKKSFTFSGNGGVFNDPVVDGNGNVYVSMGVLYVYSIAPTGKLNWMYTHSDTSALGDCVVASYGYTYVGTTKGVFALTPSGTSAWYFQDGLTMFAPSTVILDPDIDSTHSVFVAGRGNTNGGFLYSINGGTGAQYWSATTPGGTSAVVVGGGFATVGYPGLGVTGGSVSVSAYDTTQGVLAWSNTLTINTGLYSMFLFGQDNNGAWLRVCVRARVCVWGGGGICVC